LYKKKKKKKKKKKEKKKKKKKLYLDTMWTLAILLTCFEMIIMEGNTCP
jgi:hypothetical protein